MPSEYRIGDWLDLHGATRESVLTALRLFPNIHFNYNLIASSDPFEDVNISPSLAWEVVVNSMVHALPANAEQILEIAESTHVNFNQYTKNGKHAFALYDKNAGVPSISLKYRNDYGSLLTLAHEFGHALHYGHVTESFVAPVIREICASFSELALIDFLQHSTKNLYRGVVCEWSFRKNSEILAATKSLESALTNNCARYSYEWNYAMAHKYAWGYFNCAPRCEVWQVYAGELRRLKARGPVQWHDEFVIE